MTLLFLDMSNGESEHVKSLLNHAAELCGCKLDGDLNDILAALNSKISASSAPLDIASTGAVFGEALANIASLKWVMVFDEHGYSFGLQKHGKSLVCFPFDMIQKRVQQGEALSLIDLVESTVEALQSTDAGDEKEADFVQCVFGLDTVDLTAKHKDGSILLVLVTIGPMVDDPRTIQLLEYKLATYEEFAAHEYPDHPIIIKVTVDGPPGAKIQTWLEQQDTRLRAEAIRFEIEVCAEH